MTREAYYLQECLTECVKYMDIPKGTRSFLVGQMWICYKDASRNLDSSTRWIFRVVNYDEKLFEQFKTLTDNQFVAVARYEELSYCKDTSTDTLPAMYGYFLSNVETTKDEMVALLGDKAHIFPPAGASIQQYDLHLKDVGKLECFGNEDVRNAMQLL